MPACDAFGSIPTQSDLKTYLTDNTGKKSHLGRFFNNADANDKIFKMAVAVADATVDITSGMDISDRASDGIYSTRSALKDTRMVFALLNIFRGIIAGAYQLALTIARLVKGIFNPPKELDEKGRSKGVSLKVGAKEHNEFAVGRLEQGLALGAAVGKFGSAMAFIGGFGICRPIAFTEKRFGELGETSSAIGQAFPTVMMANHISSAIGNSFEMAYQKVAYKRAFKQNSAQKDVIEANYAKKMAAAFVGLITKILELASDIILHLQVIAPLYIKVPLVLLIGGLSLAEAWRKTA